MVDNSRGSEVQALVSQLSKRSLTKTEMRRCKILVGESLSALENKVISMIASCPAAPVMSTYSSDGWGAKLTTFQRELLGVHCKVNQRGRIRHELCLERALVRQLRPSGEKLCFWAGVPRGMCNGKRAANFLTAYVDFMPTLAAMGATGLKIQMHNLDGLHAAAFGRLTRGRYALPYTTHGVFETE